MRTTKIAVVLWLATAIPTLADQNEQVPTCLRLETNEMVQCYDPGKIDDAIVILRKRGIAVDKAYVISIDTNRGKRVSAKALADWIANGAEP